jgi:hypothetical protein
MCGGEKATAMQTNLENGSTLSVGQACMVIFHLSVAAEMLEMMPDENRAAYAEVLTSIIDKLAAAANLTVTAVDGDHHARQLDAVPLMPGERGKGDTAKARRTAAAAAARAGIVGAAATVPADGPQGAVAALNGTGGADDDQ